MTHYKHLLFSLVFLFWSTYQILAQVHVFPDSNAAWINEGYDHITHTLSFRNTYCMDTDDTLINTFIYSKIYYCGGAYKGATRIEGERVYFIPKDSTNDYLLYAFDVASEDVLNNVYIENITGTTSLITSVTVADSYTMEMDGITRRVIETTDHATWIEGIGNPIGLFQSNGLNVSDLTLNLACMSDNDTTYYPNFSINNCLRVTSTNNATDRSILNLYPMPCYDHLTVEWPETLKVSAFAVYNDRGDKIRAEQLISNTHKMILDTAILPNGLYSILLYASSNSFNQTFMILK